MCGEHFVSGNKAADWDRHNEDWVPILKLGQNKIVKKDHQAVADRAERATERRKRKLENELVEERKTKNDER